MLVIQRRVTVCFSFYWLNLSPLSLRVVLVLVLDADDVVLFDVVVTAAIVI